MFTDEDLKQLKDAIQADHEIGESGTLEADKVERLFRINGRALIARLEAAETYIHDPWRGNLIAWRKVAGK